MGERTFANQEELEAYVAERIKAQSDKDNQGKVPYLPTRKPERFNPALSTFSDWILGWESYMTLLHLPKGIYLGVLKTFLETDALKLISSRQFSDEEETNWEETVKPALMAILDSDRVIDKEALKSKFLKTAQQLSEDIATFGSRVKRAYFEAYGAAANEDLLKLVFQNGLRNRNLVLQLSMWQMDLTDTPRTFTEVLTRAQKIESAMGVSTALEINDQTHDILAINRHTPEPPRTRAEFPAERRSFYPHHQQQARAPMNFRPEHTRGIDAGQSGPSRYRHQETRTCFYCNRVGHIVRDCRTKQRDQYRDRNQNQHGGSSSHNNPASEN